jgi:hypothetical protein
MLWSRVFTRAAYNDFELVYKIFNSPNNQKSTVNKKQIDTDDFKMYDENLELNALYKCLQYNYEEAQYTLFLYKIKKQLEP